MARVLEEYCDRVIATDLYDYGFGEAGHDFLQTNIKSDFIFANPPFNLAIDFALHGMDLAERGLCILARLQWLEGKDRWERLFSKYPLTYVCPFVERAPMAKGRYDPDGTSAMAYAWFIWLKTKFQTPSFIKWIPPCKDTLTKEDDRAKFGGAFWANSILTDMLDEGEGEQENV
jgi:hypothetical protein